MEMEDLIGEILLHLPVKSLFRCRCLSKKWDHYIVFNSYFRRRYLSMLSCPPFMLGFFQNIRTGPRFIPTCNDAEKVQLNHFDPTLDFLGHQKVFVVGSSNGFLLCCLEKYFPENYIVCNPITKKWVALSRPNKRSECATIGFICQGNHSCLDKVKYRVVRGVYPRGRGFYDTLTFEIFYSESFAWEVLNVSCSVLFCLVLQRGSAIVNAEGIIHWFAVTQSLSPGVVVFDPREERLQLIAVPEEMLGCDGWLIESGGEIVLSQQDRTEIEMWVLGVGHKGKREWTLKRRVNIEMMCGNFDGITKSEISVLCGNPLNPHVLFVSIPAGSVYNIFSYDMDKSNLDFVCVLAREAPYWSGYYSPFICSTSIPLIQLWDV